MCRLRLIATLAYLRFVFAAFFADCREVRSRVSSESAFYHGLTAAQLVVAVLGRAWSLARIESHWSSVTSGCSSPPTPVNAFSSSAEAHQDRKTRQCRDTGLGEGRRRREILGCIVGPPMPRVSDA